MKAMSNGSLDNGGLNRRRFLYTVFGAYAMSAPLGFVSMQLAGSTSRSLTKEQRDKMTPSQVIDELKKGNEKVVVVLGHTACGAVKGAIDDVVLGNLTGLLARIKPAVSATKFDGEKSSKNATYLDAVARTNVLLGLAETRRRSPILEELETKGTIKIAGAMYDLTTGTVDFIG
jgi:hypothetical protein